MTLWVIYQTLLLLLLLCLFGCAAEQKPTLIPSVAACSAMRIDMDRWAIANSPSRLEVALGFIGLVKDDPKDAQDWLNKRWDDIQRQQKEIDDCWKAVRKNDTEVYQGK